MEVGEDPEVLRAEWRQMLEDAQKPRPLMPKTGKCKQMHSTNRHHFLPNLPEPGAITLQGREVKAGTGGQEGMNEGVR